MRFIRSSKFAHVVFPSALWSLRDGTRSIFITIDDGPTFRTCEILNLLKHYGAKATFFCVGQNVVNNRALFDEIRNSGHQIGNHTFSHSKGWRVSKNEYLKDVELAYAVIQSPLFRPPYGKMSLEQYRALRKTYRIVMWSHLAYDFDPKMSALHFIQRLDKDFQGGEIVVIHDNLKFFDQSLEMLKQLLQWAHDNGITCLPIPNTVYVNRF